MNTKKSGQKKAEAQEEVATLGINPFVDILWSQYEFSLDRAQELIESREEAYLQSVNEVIKFNKAFRTSLADFYQQSKKTNSEIIEGISSNLAKHELGRPELTEQIKEVTDNLEKMALTPIQSTFGLIDRLETNIEESSENLVQYSRERRKGWLKVTDEYVKLAKNNQKMLVNRLEESVKELVPTK